MNKRQYILHYILKPDFSGEEDLHAQRAAISAQVEAAGGAVEASLCQDGARRLAYPIKRNDRGFFCETAFTLEPQGVKSIYEALRLEPSILRYVIEVKSAAARLKPKRKPRTKLETLEKAESFTPSAMPVKPDTEVEKLSIEELDKKLDEIIKNI